MELDLQRATEIAERLLELQPSTCDVHLFSDDATGGYGARVALALGDPLQLDLAALAEQLRALAELLDAEELKITSVTSLTLMLAAATADA